MQGMKRFLLCAMAAAFVCSCQQQAPRTLIQTEVPIYTTSEKMVRVSKKKRSRYKKMVVTEVNMVPLTGPEALEWDIFDRADAVMKFNDMPLKDKEILFESVARVYANLPQDNTLTSEAINTGIWKEVTDKGVDLSFGKDPADWHPYLMYIHPIVIGQMTNFFLHAKDGSITNEELTLWQTAGCNVINAKPDSLSMAAMLARKDDLAKAGIIIEESEGAYKATTTKVDWDKYRAEHQ